MDTRQHLEATRTRHLQALTFCLVCVVVNLVGAGIALTFNLPIYLDSVGTILVSIVGGYVPGIAVGYVTNIVNSVMDSSSMYYSIVNVVIALIVAYLARRGWFRRLSRTLLASLILAVVCGCLGLLLSYFLNGGNLGNEMSAPLALQLQALGVGSATASQVVAELFVNLVDKALVVLMATLVYHMLPQGLLEGLDFAIWQQTPLSPQELDAAMNVKPRGISLATKFIIAIASVITVVSLATTAFSQIAFHRSAVEMESEKAKGITGLMAKVVDPNRVAEFLVKGESAPGYLETEAKLAEIRDSFENVQYVYVYQIRPDGCHVVLDPDTADEPGSDPGDVVPFDESFRDYIPALLAGDEIDPIVTNDTYGWLLTAYTPLRNSRGETMCYLAVDVSMERLISDEFSFVSGIVSLFAAFFVLICAVTIWLARYGIIVPVNSIVRASHEFFLAGTSIRKENLDIIKRLDIHTGDEIENLYDSIGQMSEAVVSHIAEAQEKSEAIARMQSNLIMVLADLVESRDKFTGDHVRNTATYALIIMNQMRREGICPDVLTNEFISNVYQSAPLHDIGKIAVSDVILNKPGRLTDEEFAQMKNHTVAGQEILENAKSAVSESSYLDEAQRLAAYHHEKWNGTGYPYGLAGEEIPLSARIMAVADVFDALVSKRSYKEGFPVEKAFAIIEEGIDTHFDPQVARAFLHAQDKARAVVEEGKRKKQEEEERMAAEAAAAAAGDESATTQQAEEAKR